MAIGKKYASGQTQQPKGPYLGGILVTKVVHELHEVRGSSDSLMSFGELIDEHLAACAHKFETVQKIEFQIADDQWNEIAQHLRATTRNPETGAWPDEAVEVS